jgi:signal transduction histidine kinase/ActR/RegA family two-component response regulator
MNGFSQTLRKIADYFGAQEAPSLREHERDRALQRAIVTLIVLGVWGLETIRIGYDQPQAQLGLPLLFAYLLVTLCYRQYLKSNLRSNLHFLYAFLALDPVIVLLVFVLDPTTFAFFYPLLLVVVIRTGIRYGLRTMYFSWGVALVATPLLLTNRYWRAHPEIASALLVMLLCTPMFFSSLVRRIHNVRAIEEERARLAAIHEAVLARSSFLARVSHELRSPLQGIVSALDVLSMRRGPANEADDQLIGRMRRSSLLLNTHLRDLLTLANGESGRLEIRPESFDACALVESVAASAEELASDKGLRLVVDLPPSRAFVVADCARIDQILTNLVINSVRYTALGEVRISMDAYNADTRLLRFTVSDTGPGIPEVMLPALLSPDKSSTGAERRGAGSGIGLAIVRTLMSHLGGHVEVASQVGVGTTFSLSIPAESAASVDADSSPDSLTGKVLIVDDREDVLDALTSVVDELGFECDRAPSAAVAANLLASRTYDAVMIDIEMPIKNGVDLASEIRRGSGPNRATRFIGMSAGVVDDAVRDQFDACLAKPIEHAALRRALLGPGQGARPSQPGLWTDTL